MIILFVTSVMTMMTVESAFNVIWRVRKPRPFAQRVLVYWAIITLGPILIGVQPVDFVLSVHAVAWRSRAVAAHVTPVIDWALTGAALPLTALAFTMLYVYLPNCRVEWRDAVIGGLVAAIAFELAKRGFGYYVRRIPTYTAVYGAFAAVPMFLLWMYLCWFIALAGAMVASALPAIRIGQFHRPRLSRAATCSTRSNCSRGSPRRARRASAATRLRDLRACFVATWIRRSACCDKLEEIEWIARLEDDDSRPRFLLLANPNQITVSGCSTCS